MTSNVHVCVRSCSVCLTLHEEKTPTCIQSVTECYNYWLAKMFVQFFRCIVQPKIYVPLEVSIACRVDGGREGEHTAQKQAGRADSPSLVTKRVREPHKVIFKQVNYKGFMQNPRALAHRVSSRGTETTNIELLTFVSADDGHRASLSMRQIPALLLLSSTGAQVKPQRKVAVPLQGMCSLAWATCYREAGWTKKEAES